MSDTRSMIRLENGSFLCLERGCSYTGTMRQVSAHRQVHQTRSGPRPSGSGRIRRRAKNNGEVYWTAELPRRLTNGVVVSKAYKSRAGAQRWLDRTISDMERALHGGETLPADTLSPDEVILGENPWPPLPRPPAFDQLSDAAKANRVKIAEVLAPTLQGATIPLTMTAIIAQALLAYVASETTTSDERRRATEAYAELFRNTP